MADQKISAMPSANTPLTGDELVPLVQDGVNVQSTIANFGQYARDAYFSYGSFLSTIASQSGAANEVKSLLFNVETEGINVSLGTPASRVVVANAGVYSIIASMQLSNSDANFDDFTMWLTLNGAAVANSASTTSAPAKKGSANGLAILTVQYTITLTAGQYIGFDYFSPAGSTAIVTFPASLTAPAHPASPAVILSIIQIA